MKTVRMKPRNTDRNRFYYVCKTMAAGCSIHLPLLRITGRKVLMGKKYFGEFLETVQQFCQIEVK